MFIHSDSFGCTVPSVIAITRGCYSGASIFKAEKNINALNCIISIEVWDVLVVFALLCFSNIKAYHSLT